MSSGVLTALGGYTYQRIRKADKMSEEEEEVDRELTKLQLEEKEEDEDWSEGMELSKWVIMGAMAGTLGGLALSPFIVHSYYKVSWGASWLASAKATAFFAPPVTAYALVGPDEVARNIPVAIAISVGITAAGTLAVVPITAAATKSQIPLYYMAALRIVGSSSASLMTGIFAQRYAWIQRSKGHGKKSTEATETMDSIAIWMGQFAGNGIAACWGYIALTEWAGSHYPHWMHALPDVYFLAVVVHLLAPSRDHDQRAATLMARSGLVALHTIVFIPSVSSFEVAHKVQIIVGQALTAAWFGTFSGEWGTEPKETRQVASGLPTGTEVAQSPTFSQEAEKENVEKMDTGADAADTVAHLTAAFQ